MTGVTRCDSLNNLFLYKLCPEVGLQRICTAPSVYLHGSTLFVHPYVIPVNPRRSCDGWTSRYVNLQGSGSMFTLSVPVLTWNNPSRYNNPCRRLMVSATIILLLNSLYLLCTVAA